MLLAKAPLGVTPAAGTVGGGRRYKLTARMSTGGIPPRQSDRNNGQEPHKTTACMSTASERPRRHAAKNKDDEPPAKCMKMPPAIDTVTSSQLSNVESVF